MLADVELRLSVFHAGRERVWGPMVKRLIPLILVASLSTMGAASSCGEGQQSIAPGKHTVTKQMRGSWKANGAVQGCKWVVQTKGGSIVNKGQWTLSNRTQAVILGTGNVGMIFWPNDACGTWRR